jgi:hypothetical protein
MPNTPKIKPGDRIRYTAYDARPTGIVVAVGGGFVIATDEREPGRHHTVPLVAPVESVEVVS